MRDHGCVVELQPPLLHTSVRGATTYGCTYHRSVLAHNTTVARLASMFVAHPLTRRAPPRNPTISITGSAARVPTTPPGHTVGAGARGASCSAGCVGANGLALDVSHPVIANSPTDAHTTKTLLQHIRLPVLSPARIVSGESPLRRTCCVHRETNRWSLLRRRRPAATSTGITRSAPTTVSKAISHSSRFSVTRENRTMSSERPALKTDCGIKCGGLERRDEGSRGSASNSR